MEALISFKDFTFKYDLQKNPTLKKINLEIFPGEKVLIVGPSGSGKSTIGSCLNGILPHLHKGEASGELSIAGLPFGTSIAELSEKVSTILQDTDGQFIGLSVAEDIAFALENDGLIHDELVSKVAYWSDKTETNKLLKHRPQDLSGGQKQRVSLAGVLIDESPILLFDEPLANLDPKSGQDIIELIDQIHKEEGTTTLIIEHRLEDVLHRPVDRIVLINDGRILFNGSPDQLLATDLLTQNGIREPLYLTTLRQLGVDLAKEEQLANLDNLSISKGQIQLRTELVKETPELQSLFKLEDVSFSYDDRPILKDVSAEIKENTMTAIVGPSGSGKTTFCNLIARFWDVNSGEILIGGKNIKDYKIENLMNSISMVFQDVYLFEDTIENNIKFGKQNASHEEVVQAAKKARCHEFIEALPEGYNTLIGEGGASLSGGEKQRISIARAMLKDAGIIIFDEATANIDPENEDKLKEAIESLTKNKTVIMIAHRLKTIRNADQILVLKDGEIVERGSHEELIKNNGLYSDLINAKAKAESWKLNN